MVQAVTFPIDALEAMKNYPKALYYQGHLELLQKRKISVVGTRNPFFYTKMLTQQLTHCLAQAGICVVSGGAIGVDAIAHASAGVENTILVSPSGLDVIYPAVNRQLIRNMYEDGLALSMYEPNFKATPWSFVARNEMVVALGEALVVAQADMNSGSLRSVEFALKMGKPIYVFPHRLGESQGTNHLLKNNLAQAIYDIDEFVNQFTPLEERVASCDEFLEYCQNNPLYDEAVFIYGSKVFEYELQGKIEVKNGRVSVFIGHKNC